jgi:hypothetical protein
VTRQAAAVVSALAVLVAALACAGAQSAVRAEPPVSPTLHFVTRPDLRPPPVHILTPAHDTAPGYVFIAPKKDVNQAGPLIIDNKGHVVWFHPLDTHGVTDFRVQSYRGRPVLTWWRGETAKGIGNGRYVISDTSYRVIANVTAGNGLSGDIHEFLITPQNTALFTVYRKLPYDLSALGGPKDGSIMEGIVQEVDIPTGRVLFEWHTFPEIAVDESYAQIPTDASDPYDYFHINAIDVDRDGNLLVSGRHTHAIYKVRRSDGKVLWRLGGKRSDFKIGPGARFAWQHDVRRQPDGTISLFDNNAAKPVEGLHSKVLRLKVDEKRRTVTLVRSYTHSNPVLLSPSQGNAQFLPDGHVFVGWGSSPYFTEFGRNGRVLLDGRFGSGPAEVDSYRAFRYEWTGRPVDRPAVVARRVAGGTRVFVSWNGATEVARWRVLAGPDASRLARVAEVPKREFETAVGVPSTARLFLVQALDAQGRVLRASLPVRRSSGS